uniref:MATH domain-containing protein n=1 Tax=Heterorhabditis bacteriophora TaxID=37862 RepID=A0A1I7WD27_HETBA
MFKNLYASNFAKYLLILQIQYFVKISELCLLHMSFFNVIIYFLYSVVLLLINFNYCWFVWVIKHVNCLSFLLLPYLKGFWLISSFSDMKYCYIVKRIVHVYVTNFGIGNEKYFAKKIQAKKLSLGSEWSLAFQIGGDKSLEDHITIASESIFHNHGYIAKYTDTLALKITSKKLHRGHISALSELSIVTRF